MAKNTLTFELGGVIDIRHLEEGVTAFRRLLSALSSKSNVKWSVDDLQPGSAITTLRGESGNAADVEHIIDQFEEIGRALERQEEIKFQSRVISAAEAIKKLAESVEYVRFETPAQDYTVYGNGLAEQQAPTTVAIGAIVGRVQTLSSRAGLRFNLYDTIHDKAVACYLEPGQEELMRETWGRRARVSGRISRQANTGRPLAIRQILAVEILEDSLPGSYRQARGTVPWRPGDLLPEDAIRRLRDA